MFQRILLFVMDSVGAGALPDAEQYGDKGTNTLAHICEQIEDLYLKNLHSLGMGNIISLPHHPPLETPQGIYGKSAEASRGKDTTTGHWELMGLIKHEPWPVYPNGFPPEVIKPFQRATGRKVLYNKPASGTEIIKQLGQKHMETGNPIVYTSADSVFQIACHEEIVPPTLLYTWCKAAREILQEEHAVARVIARPFKGEAGNFRRTSRRKDFSLPTPQRTSLDILKEAGISVTGIGKIEDIFCGRGLTRSFPTENNAHGISIIKEVMSEIKSGLIFVNFVDFDMLYGHRNDTRGYAQALREFDLSLPAIMEKMEKKDLLILTADHGCDPTFKASTDHTREYVPLLAWGPDIKSGISIGTRYTFADTGKTILHNWKLQDKLANGKSFYGKFTTKNSNRR